jgi:outer membrane protein TolC
MKIIIYIIAFIFSSQLIGQDVLTLEDAKIITLDNNFGIKISRNNVDIASNNTQKKANNYLPNVSVTGGPNATYGRSSQQFNNGLDASTDNAIAWGINASVQADYNIVDRNRKLTLDQLKEVLILSDLQLKQTIEQNLLQVYNIYFSVAQFSANIAALQEAILISNERLRRAQYLSDLGQGSGLDVLNAKVDIQRDSVNILNATMNLENEKRNLNIAMGRSADIDFKIDPESELSVVLDLNTIMDVAKEENISVLVNKQNLAVNALDIELIEAEKKPIVFAGASYDYSYANNQPGSFVTTSNSRGLSANVGLSWNVFDGTRDIRKQNSIINLTNQELVIQQLQQEIERDILNAWANYENALFVLSVEENALRTNEENFRRTEDQVNMGQLSSIEFRQAQLNLLNSQTSLNNAKFNARLREIQLIQLAGDLID